MTETDVTETDVTKRKFGAQDRYERVLARFNEDLALLKEEFPTIVPYFRYEYDQVTGIRSIRLKELQTISDDRKEEMIKRAQGVEGINFINVTIDVAKPE
jgi:hypothetical protein